MYPDRSRKKSRVRDCVNDMSIFDACVKPLSGKIFSWCGDSKYEAMNSIFVLHNVLKGTKVRNRSINL